VLASFIPCTTCTSAQTSCRSAASPCHRRPRRRRHRHGRERLPPALGTPSQCVRTSGEAERRKILLDSAKQVRPAIFFRCSSLWCRFSGFLLEAQEGRMFRRSPGPRHWPWVFLRCWPSRWFRADASFHSRRLRPESQNPLSRLTQLFTYLCWRLCLRFRQDDLADQFDFPDRYSSPRAQDREPIHASLFEARLVHAHGFAGNLYRQASCASGARPHHPHVPRSETVFGTIGVATAHDNAPLDMYDTTIMLKPREKWVAG